MHSPSRWTSSTTDTRVFTYYPWQLAYTSSVVKRDCDVVVRFIDGCLEKCTKEQLAQKIVREQPTHLLMEPATRTWDEDWWVMQRVKAETNALLLVAGQHAMAHAGALSQVVDAVLLGEYEYTVRDIMRGDPLASIQGVWPNPRRELLDVATLPWPEDT
ncbi:MAG: radical SAM protein, partial [Spirochaetia bacterium]|nr:radical SAM protein [Spirochaetia bacterium]